MLMKPHHEAVQLNRKLCNPKGPRCCSLTRKLFHSITNCISKRVQANELALPSIMNATDFNSWPTTGWWWGGGWEVLSITKGQTHLSLLMWPSEEAQWPTYPMAKRSLARIHVHGYSARIHVHGYLAKIHVHGYLGQSESNLLGWKTHTYLVAEDMIERRSA